MARARRRAADYRKFRVDPHRPKIDTPPGYVEIWRGKPCGWFAVLDDETAHRRKPGCLAVGVDGCVYQTVGGNDNDGAAEWRTCPGQTLCIETISGKIEYR
jgi:hypothetical protein